MAAPTVVVQRTAYSGFDDDSPRYKCCCNCCHVKTGAIIIGVLELIGALCNFGGLIAQYVQGRSLGLQGSIYYGLVGASITIIVVILLFVGIGTEVGGWVIPHLIFQILGIIWLIICGILFIVALAVDGTSMNGQITGIKMDWYTGNIYVSGCDYGCTLGIAIFAICIFFIAALFEIWFFVVIFRYYKYCVEKRDASSMATTVQYTNQSNQGYYSQSQPNQSYYNQGYAKYA